MPIDPKQALGALISQDTKSWGPDQVILYHLGLGAGVPPMDDNELAYTYEKGLKVLPSFGVIASYISGAGKKLSAQVSARELQPRRRTSRHMKRADMNHS